MQISRELFDRQRRPRFGNANPERMRLEFWEWMISGEENPSKDEEGGLAGSGFIMRAGKLKSGYGPYRARDLFNVPLNREDGPIWTFDRMGRTTSELPDGRVVCISGEHEDSYDPDFCIYNDVVVFGPKDRIAVYGYPREIFLPTDFHTATVFGNRIIIVGGLGYPDARRLGHTPVYELDLSSFRIARIKTSGKMLGWIFKHSAELDPGGTIVIRSGELVEERAGEQRYRRNVEDYALDVGSGVWRRLTNRNWRQFSICQEDGSLFVLNNDVKLKDLIPEGLERRAGTDGSYREGRFLVRGVPIRVIAGVRLIEIIVEGELPEEINRDMPEVFRSRVETLCKKKCVLV
jgi:hypothetical protein